MFASAFYYNNCINNVYTGGLKWNCLRSPFAMHIVIKNFELHKTQTRITQEKSEN